MIATRPEAGAPTDLPSPRPPARRLDWVTAGIAVAVLAAFGTVQLILEARDQRAWFRLLAARAGPAVARQVTFPRWPEVVAAMLVFIGLELSGLVLVARGRRLAFVVPAVWWILVPVLTVPGPFGRSPAPVGPGWTFQWVAVMHAAHPLLLAWSGAAVDLVMVLAPALVLLRRSQASGRHAPAAPPGLAVAAVGFCAFILWLVIYVRGTAVLSHTAWEELPVLGSAFVFGVLLGTRWPTVWFLALVPVLLVTSWIEVIGQGLPWSAEAFAHTAPWALVAVLGAGWEPVARALKSLQRRTGSLLAVVNGLNVADALLTAFAVNHAQAVETNPLVRAVGLPAKIVAVGLVSVILARHAPRALAWPALALLAVVAWHLGGLYLNAHV